MFWMEMLFSCNFSLFANIDEEFHPATSESLRAELGHFVVMAVHSNASAITRDCIDSRNRTIIISTDILIERSYTKDLHSLLNYVGFSDTIEFIGNHLRIIIPHNLLEILLHSLPSLLFSIYIIGLFRFFNHYPLFSLSLIRFHL